MMAQGKYVGGIHCFEVLEHLSDYLDDQLPQHTRTAIEDHLAQCQECASFGGRYSTLIKTLHQHYAKGYDNSDKEAISLAKRLLTNNQDQ